MIFVVTTASVHSFFFVFSSRRRHTRWPRDWSSDVCSSDLFHDQDGQDERGLAIAGPAEVGEDLGRDAGGRNQSDPAQEHRRYHPPSEEQTGDETRGEVQRDVECPCSERAPHRGQQLCRGVLEPQCKEQQDQSDLASGPDELARGDQWQEAALSEGETGEEIERDGRNADPPRQPGQDGQTDDDGAELDKRGRVHLCAYPGCGTSTMSSISGGRPALGEARSRGSQSMPRPSSAGRSFVLFTSAISASLPFTVRAFSSSVFVAVS